MSPAAPTTTAGRPPGRSPTTSSISPGFTEARGITDAGSHFRLGALTTWSELAAAGLPPQFDALT
ncbi:MAG: hypothetical protein U1E43_10380 [Rhodospirillales bacterium]